MDLRLALGPLRGSFSSDGSASFSFRRACRIVKRISSGLSRHPNTTIICSPSFRNASPNGHFRVQSFFSSGRPFSKFPIPTDCGALPLKHTMHPTVCLSSARWPPDMLVISHLYEKALTRTEYMFLRHELCLLVNLGPMLRSTLGV